MNAKRVLFKKKKTISTFTGNPLKLVEQFTSIGSNIIFTKSDVNICLAKAWKFNDRLSIIWKSKLSNKIKQFLPSYSIVHNNICMHHMDANKTHGEKYSWKLHENAVCQKATPHKTATVEPPVFYHKKKKFK